jgi:hypothetical protein
LVLPKIFLSHSAKSEAAAAILEQIYFSLTDHAFDVLLDRARLREDVGRPWRDALNTWLELCHGAVVLLDEHAIRSAWVKQEVAILAWRRLRDRRFLVVPILVPPVTVESLPELGFAPSDMASLQAITVLGREGPSFAREPAQQWLDILLQRFSELHQGRRPLTSIERIEDLLMSSLKTIDSELIVQAASEMGEDLGRWSPNLPPSLALARLLLRAGLLDSIRVLGLLPIDPPQFERVCRLIATSWINCRAIEPIQRIAEGPEPQRSIAINGSEFLLSQWYLLRASGAAAPWPQVEVRLGCAEDDPQAVVAQVRDSLLLAGPPDRVSRDRYLKDLQSPLAARTRPVFLVFEAPEPDPEILGRLREEFPAFTFFLLTGNYVPPAEEQFSRCGGYFLRPEIQLSAADAAITAWSLAHHQLFATVPGSR